MGENGKLTGIRSAYFWRMRSASALRFSKGCSSLNLERMVKKQGGSSLVAVKLAHWYAGSVVMRCSGSCWLLLGIKVSIGSHC